jgi:hypothetical protein
MLVFPRFVLAGIILVFMTLVAYCGYEIWLHATHHCVASHHEWVERSCTRMSYDPGDPMYWVENCTEAHDETFCDRWEKNQ